MADLTPSVRLSRKLGPPGAAAAVLVAISVLRFVFPHTQGIMLLSIVPIIALGMMLGVRAGLAAALYASASFLVWAAVEGNPDTLEYTNRPLTFFVLGLISGHYAHGALGDYNLRRISANRRLQHGIGRQEVGLHYQPIVQANGRGVIAVEALARWQHPERGLILPPEFIPIAERDEDTMWTLTVHTLEVAARDAAGWNGTEDFCVSVNLSPVSLMRPELPEVIGQILDDAGVPHQRLGVEVTESPLAEGDRRVLDVLESISRIGLGMVAIDDFGTGHSSLARLDRLPIDTLKIDLEIIQGIPRPQTEAIVRAVVELAHAIGLTVVAEGVEEQEVRGSLAEMGCDAVQGLAVSRPLPPDEFARWLAQPVAAAPRRDSA